MGVVVFFWGDESMSQKRLLLLGGSHAEIPLIKAAQGLGWYVITTGNNRDGMGQGCSRFGLVRDYYWE